MTESVLLINSIIWGWVLGLLLIAGYYKIKDIRSWFAVRKAYRKYERERERGKSHWETVVLDTSVTGGRVQGWFSPKKVK